MQKNKIHILSTKPLGKEIVNIAAQNDIIIDEIPFIKTEEIISKEIKEKIKKLAHQNITVVFTSRNAVEAVRKFISTKPSWRIFCIGNTTESIVASVFGEENIIGTAFDGNKLSEKIIEKKSIKKIVFFCGDQRRYELPANLKKNGIEVEEMVVYETLKTPVTLTNNYDGILFFSPGAVQSFFSVNSINNSTQIFAIGNTTANEIKYFTKQPVIISEVPDKKKLLNLAIEYLSKSKIV